MAVFQEILSSLVFWGRRGLIWGFFFYKSSPSSAYSILNSFLAQIRQYLSDIDY